MKNKILICGAGDFITGHLIRKLRQNNSSIDALELTKHLKSYASIGEKYVTILDDIIERNSLTDFDNSNLLSTNRKKGVEL